MTKQTFIRVFGALACLLFSASAILAQTNPAPSNTTPDSIPVFHATSRLVMLDVVVTDHHGAFVPGLKAHDFTVLEDGKPQNISGFVLHITPSAPPKAVPPLSLPPHQFSNFTRVPQQTDRPVTVVLLDMLNTTGQDQQYARKQMIQFLKGLPEGRPVALFTLTSQLKLVQGFTGDSDTLVKAATAILANSSLLIGSEAQMQQDEIDARTLETASAPPTMGPNSGSGTTGTMPIAPIGQAIRDAASSEDTFGKLERMNITLNALDVLARAVAGYSGRKNLLWLSAEFPITFGPDLNPYNQSGQPMNQNTGKDTNHQLHNLQYETPALQQTAALLAAAQVAVYPIDARGTINPGTGIDISAQTSNLGQVDLQSETQTANLRQINAEWDTHEAMTDIARETGGHAFYGTNDLKDALAHGMDEGSDYYTLAYSPLNRDWNSKYRKIEIKTATPGLKLTYRRGYYAVPTRPYTGDKMAASMAMAMKFSVPELTMVYLKAQVLPPDAEHKAVRIDYAVNAHDLVFADGTDQRKYASIDFVATAWDKDSKLVTHTADTMNATLRPEVFDQVMKTGLPFHQELELKPGKYLLRLGVLDRGSQKIGTVDVPLTIPGDLGSSPAKSSH